MSSLPSHLYVRTEQGQVFGPIAPAKVGVLLEKGMLQGRVEVSLDGQTYALPGDVEAVRDLFPEALWTGQSASPASSRAPAIIAAGAAPAPGPAPAPPPPSAAPAGVPMAGPGAMQNAARSSRTSNVQAPLRDSAPAARPPTPAPPAAAPPPPAAAEPRHPSGEHRLAAPGIPASGDLTQTSAVKLYALAAASSGTGLFRFVLADRTVELHFRKGGAEHFESSHPEDALGTFLVEQKAITPAQLASAEAEKARFGGEVFSALMGLGLVQAGNIFALLAQRALGLMVKVALAPSGTFTVEPVELAAAKALPLGNRWSVLGDVVRKIPAAELKRKLADVMDLPVLKSNGWVELSDLKLTPQEVRALGFFDGVRTLTALLELPRADADPVLRLAYLLREVGGVSFVPLASKPKAAAAPPPVAAAPPKAPAASLPPAGPRPAPPTAARAPTRPAAAEARPPSPAPAPAPPAAPPPPAVPASGAHPAQSGESAPPAWMRPAVEAVPAPAPAASTGSEAGAVPEWLRSAAPPASAPAAASISTAAAAAAAAPPPAARPSAPAAGAPDAEPAWLASARRAAEPAPAPRTDASFQDELKELRARAAKLKGETYFEVLGLSEKADAAAVKVAYFKLAKLYHPDTVPPEAPPDLSKLKADIFSVVSEAYRTLTDEKSRQNYLEELKYGGGDKIDVAQILMAEETFQKATLMVKARKFPEAVKLLDEAIKANPDEGEFYAWRGFARYFTNPDKVKGNQEAHQDFLQAIKRNERCAPAHFFMGQVAKLGGQEAAAIKHFKRTVELQPEHIDAQRELRILANKKA